MLSAFLLLKTELNTESMVLHSWLFFLWPQTYSQLFSPSIFSGRKAIHQPEEMIFSFQNINNIFILFQPQRKSPVEISQFQGLYHSYFYEKWLTLLSDMNLLCNIWNRVLLLLILSLQYYSYICLILYKDYCFLKDRTCV